MASEITKRLWSLEKRYVISAVSTISKMVSADQFEVWVLVRYRQVTR